MHIESIFVNNRCEERALADKKSCSITDINGIVTMQDHYTHAWHDSTIDVGNKAWSDIVLSNHSHNYQLWYQEDKARRDDMGFEYVYNAKRAIDKHNQQRNNMMEAMDIALFEHFQFGGTEHLPLHSETPGMIIDRLSILSLKIYHMNIEAQRDSADAKHRKNAEQKHAVLLLQRKHLQQALERLFAGLLDKTVSFMLYKQMKMYNDPSLNPQLYNKEAG